MSGQSKHLVALFALVTMMAIPGIPGGAAPASAEPFFPIGMFSSNPPSALPELKGCGFNSAQTYRISTVTDLNVYLDAAARSGMKALVYPGLRIDQGTLTEAPATTLARIWPQVQNSSAVLAWYLADEPEHTTLSVSDLIAFDAAVKSHDAAHPTALTTGPSYYDKYRQVGDILIIDPYPIPVGPVTEVSDAMEKAEAAAPGKPVWAVIQAYDRGLFEQKVRDLHLSRDTAPTYGEINCMTYLAIVHGAKGIFYYTYKELTYDIKDHPAIWNAVKKIVAGLKRLSPVFTSPTLAVTPAVTSASNGASPKNIHYLFKRYNNDIYMFLVNSASAADKVTLANLPFKNGTVLVSPESKRVLAVRDGRVNDTLQPLEVRVYKGKAP